LTPASLPNRVTIPDVAVELTPLAVYDELVAVCQKTLPAYVSRQTELQMQLTHPPDQEKIGS
jgi:hypothetical protein